ncbi:hypothetical protein MJO28_010869 [Puccinia striiformis f. sp. tritici]|uniref:Uncharacterized protein n=1 Tax=Puccinia striiformis f. sp. tritici TaxID=168172 RepID=A0ACC0E7B4_9BASI|nr:hypothetical protein MJO28_010869 [Puccinia striiformis f. sp. tritici]
MVFRSYAPATKVTVVRMMQQGFSKSNIRQSVGYDISNQSFARWNQLFEETRRVIRDPDTYETRGRPTILTTDDITFMIQLVRTNPGLFLSEIREGLYDSTGTLLSVEAIHHNLVNRLSITLKKAGTSNIRKCLVSKYNYVDEMRFFPANWLVFTDESSFCDRDLLRTSGRSEIGSPVERLVVNQNSQRISLLPAIGIDGLLAMATTLATFKGPKFENFLEFELIPSMNRYPGPNSVLVCDNANIHRGENVQRICDQAGIRIIHLPTYCPELNPIELCFGAMKTKLRGSQILSTSSEPRAEIRLAAAEVMTAEFCYSIYEHCGYCVGDPNE